MKERVSNGRAPLLAPIVIVESNDGEVRKGIARNRPANIGGEFRSYIDRGVVHVVLDPVTILHAHLDRVFGAYADIGTHVNAPPVGVTGQVCQRGWCVIVPGDVPVNSGNLDIGAFPSISHMSGDIRKRKAKLHSLK